MKLCNLFKRKKQIKMERVPENSYNKKQTFDHMSLMKEFDDDSVFVFDLLNSGIKEIDPKIDLIRICINDKDISKINDLAHGIKGATQSLMCYEISKKFHKLQLSKDIGEISSVFEQVDPLWENVKKEFKLFNDRYL